MKRILYTLLTATAVLVGNYFFSNSTLEARVETPTTTPSPTLVPLPGAVVPTPVGGPTMIPTPLEVRDPYGEVYLTSGSHLTRLPGSCVVGLIECPEGDTLQAPFNIKDIWNDGTGIAWSPDGRYGLLITHPVDELSAMKTPEELEKLKHQAPSEFNVSPSVLYMFDAQTDTWSEVYRVERKFFSTPRWSPDGEWIAFEAADSPWPFHAMNADSGIYAIHPDGSGIKHLGGADVDANILGWIGNSILLHRQKEASPSRSPFSYMEMLSLDGDIKTLFETDRLAIFTLSPDGGAILAADAQSESESSVKAVDILALDGSVLQTFGTFTNQTSSIYPSVWSRDGSLVAFANLRRVYAAPDDGLGWTGGVVEFPRDVREIYQADDTFVSPSFSNLQFSYDNKYLLMQVFDGMDHFVTVSIETGEAVNFEIKGMENEQPIWFSWRQ